MALDSKLSRPAKNPPREWTPVAALAWLELSKKTGQLWFGLLTTHRPGCLCATKRNVHFETRIAGGERHDNGHFKDRVVLPVPRVVSF